MLPLQLQRKVGSYNLKIKDVPVKATALEHEDLVDDLIDELRSRLGSFPVVGIDLKTKSTRPSSSLGLSIVTTHEVLVLYVKDRCLIIQMERLRKFPPNLLSFLADDSICFVGVGMNEKRNLLRKRFELLTGTEEGEGESILTTGIEIAYFAARLGRNRALKDCDNLEELARKVGLLFKEEEHQPDRRPDYIDLCFSNGDVMLALQEAYVCYTIANVLTSHLDKLS